MRDQAIETENKKANTYINSFPKEILINKIPNLIFTVQILQKVIYWSYWLVTVCQQIWLSYLPTKSDLAFKA